MPISLSDFHQIPSELFSASGALDPILGVDTRLFIDPSLLRAATTPELAESYSKVIEHFNRVLSIVRHITCEDDRFWREADRLLTFPEVRGLSIGYASGTSGSGMGPSLRRRLLTTIWAIVRVGVSDPEVFELVGIFEDGIGPDRVSDMLAKIIAQDLVAFTQRVCSDCGIPMQEHRLKYLHVEEDLPSNPYNGSPLILVPKQILRDLPIASDFGDIVWIAEHNETLRSELNSLIGGSWRARTTAEKKEKIRDGFMRFPQVLLEIIEAYRQAEPLQYDFAADPAGEVIWYEQSKRLAAQFPLSLQMPAKPDREAVYATVLKICDHFKSLIEDNQLCVLLYDKGTAKHESASQLLFYGIAAAYCKANALDLSPESDAGRGPVDFKVSCGFVGKVLVEIKLTSNKQLLHGFESQLPIYQAAENAERGIYLVIDNGGASAGRLASFRQKVAVAGAKAPTVKWVDGKIRPSASKADY